MSNEIYCYQLNELERADARTSGGFKSFRMVINKIIKSQRLNDQLTSGTLASAGL
jgi:hypothetical protein